MTIEDCLNNEQKKISINEKHLKNGVEFQDITSAYIDENVEIGKGTYIGINISISGNSKIGENCRIVGNTRIENSTIGSGNTIDNAVILDSQIGNNNSVGPFAYIRPNSNINDNCKIGDFVEVKNSTIDNGTKASHLTYIGDSDIGKNVNLGCGVVFVNYDGQNKYRSKVDDNAFVGCNTNIVSPVHVEAESYIAAGSTVTRNVPKGALLVARAKERIIDGWIKKRGLFKKSK